MTGTRTDSPSRLALTLACLLLALSSAAQDKPKKPKPRSNDLFEQNAVPRLRITLDKVEWNTLNHRNRDYVACTVEELFPDGRSKTYAGVGIHLKGDGGSFRGLGDKPALTLNFDYFVEDLRFHGLDKLHLNNSVQDPSYLNEALGAWVFTQAGVPAPRVTHARVWLNDRDLGLYVLKEGFDKTFLKRHFDDGSGVVYEGKVRDIDQQLPHKPDDLKNPPSLKPLVEASRENDPARRRERLNEMMDVERFITFSACENLLAHWDGYSPHRNNYRLYLDPRSKKFVFLPQGLDQLFQRPDYGIVQSGAIVSRALTQAPEDRQKIVQRVAELRESIFDAEKLNAKIDEISERLRPVLEQISADAARNHQNQAADLKRRIVERLKHVDRQLGVPPVKFDPSGLLAVNKGWESKFDGGNFKAERVEVDGKPALLLRADNASGAASFRLPIDLPRGKYSFEGSIKTEGVETTDADNAAAGLRISGGRRTSKLDGDSPWQSFSFDFEVTEDLRTVVLVCELRAKKGQAWFDPASLKIRKR